MRPPHERAAIGVPARLARRARARRRSCCSSPRCPARGSRRRSFFAALARGVRGSALGIVARRAVAAVDPSPDRRPLGRGAAAARCCASPRACRCAAAAVRAARASAWHVLYPWVGRSPRMRRARRARRRSSTPGMRRPSSPRAASSTRSCGWLLARRARRRARERRRGGVAARPPRRHHRSPSVDLLMSLVPAGRARSSACWCSSGQALAGARAGRSRSSRRALADRTSQPSSRRRAAVARPRQPAADRTC